MSVPPTTPSGAEATADHVLSLLRAHGTSDYIGERITQLAHSLQCAALAAHASPPADAATVLAALLHDIGQFLPAAHAGRLVREMPGAVGRVGHEDIGATFLARLGFADKVCGLVGAHVAAKRYLCATEDGYWASLSAASQASLGMQGGPMTEGERREWEQGPWWKEMVRLRRWDDEAKVVGLEVDDLEAYRGPMEMHLKDTASVA